MDKTIEKINLIYKEYFRNRKKQLEEIKSIKRSLLDELFEIKYKLKKGEDSLFKDELRTVRKIYKLIQKIEINFLEYYSKNIKEYEYNEGNISKTFKKYSQVLYSLNLIRSNEEIDLFSNSSREETDDCVSGGLYKYFGKSCYVFGTENNIESSFTGKQGNNVFGMQNDCGIACVTQILILSGKRITENDVARVAISEGLCDVMGHSMRENGATSSYNRASLLGKFGIDSTIEQLSNKEIAKFIEHGFGLISSVDSGILWNKETNLGIGHAIVLYGTIHDEMTGKLLGFIICDTGSGNMKRAITCEEYESMSILDRGINVTLKEIRR